MNGYKDIEFIKMQISETERMLQEVGGHPLMSKSLQIRLENLKRELENLPEDFEEPKVTLLFSGNAVKGSLGIKSKFVSSIITPLQEIIDGVTALVRFGRLGQRGKSKEIENSELFLTALPVGSFGIELSKLETNDLFDENDVSKAIQRTMKLIDSSSQSDDIFEEAVGDYPQRIISNLEKFLNNISKHESILKMKSGNYKIDLKEEKVRQAHQRVSLTKTDSKNIIIEGILTGLFSESSRFEFIDENGFKEVGEISKDILDEELDYYIENFWRSKCNLLVKKELVTYSSGRIKKSYVLLKIDEVTPQPPAPKK
jgi:hypothetical protein